LVFDRELQNNYVLCQNHRRICRRTITRRYFTESCKKITGLCHIHRRINRRIIPTDYAHPEAHTCLTRVRLHKYRWLYRRILLTESPTDSCTSQSARMCDTCPSARIPTDRKVWRDFRTFFGTHFN
jgi:hypothetical protein